MKKTAVITGGANGIGRCLVEEFAREGYDVAFIDIDHAAGQELQTKMGESVAFFPGNVAEKVDLEVFAAFVVERFGGVDCVINNACFSNGGILSGCTYEAFNEILRVGVSAPYYLACLFRPHFRPGASILNISSTRAFMSQQNTESYTAAKGGIAALTHALAMSLAGKVRVNSISPGWIDTGAFHGDGQSSLWSAEDAAQHASGRIGNPTDIAHMALYLCGDKAGFITGENITIDGGMTKRMIYHNDEGWSYTK